MGRKLAWAGVVLGAVYLIYIGGGWWGIYSPYLRITTMVIAAVTLGTWAIVAWRNPAWRPRTVMWPAIVAVLASMTISTIFSRYPRVSLEYLGYTIVLVPLYLLLVRLFADEFFRRRLMALFSMLFVVTASLYIATVIGGWIEWWQLAGATVPPLRPGFGGLTYNNPSAALTMVVLLAVPTATTFGSASLRGLLVLLAIGATVAFVALASGSRAGWFAIAVTGVLGATTWLLVPANRTRARTALRASWMRHRIRLTIIVAGLGALVLLGTVAPSILRRALDGGEDLRIGYALAALRMFAESPVVGTGPGSWVIQRPRYTTTSEPDYYIPHAHNLEVQTLGELGMVGTVASLVVVGALVRLVVAATRSGDSRSRWWAWLGGLGLLYFAVHQLLDFYVNMPAFLLAAAIPVAYLDAAQSGPRTPAPRGRPIAGSLAIAAVVIVVVGCFVGLVLQEVPALRQAAAVSSASSGDWTAAHREAEAAAGLDSSIGSYQLTAGLAAAHVGDHVAAARYFALLAETDDLPEAWLNLAAEQVELGLDHQATVSLRQALRLGHQRFAIAVAAADLALRLEEHDLAEFALANALTEAPSLAGDPYWQGDRARAELLGAAVAQASILSPLRAWEFALLTGDIDRATAHAGDRDSLAGLVVRAWTGDPPAATALLRQCHANPGDVSLVLWCARLEAHRGNGPAAERFRSMLSLINLSTPQYAAEVRVSPRGMIGLQLPGDPADLWATYTYRRPAPWDILVPTLAHLYLE